MLTQRIWTVSLLCALSLASSAGCSSRGDGGGGGAGGGSDTGRVGSGGADLAWYLGCGDPVCQGHMPQPGVTTCSTEVPGAPCSTPGVTCDPGNDCNARLVCAASDPTRQPGGCPISRARYKHDIRYLPEADLKRVHDDLVSMPIATWRYDHEGEAGREHLGFIIDDNPASPAVAAGENHVDLYGYASMAVAAIQVQEKQIVALQRELAALREELAAERRAKRRIRSATPVIRTLAIRNFLKIEGKQTGHGRDGPFGPPPVQNPACGFPAPGSHLRSTDEKRTVGYG
jgi:hypothetical protein